MPRRECVGQHGVQRQLDFPRRILIVADHWRAYSYEELLQRDKVSLDIFWLRDESLESSDNLPDSDVIAEEIAEDLRAALEQFEEIQDD